MQQLRTTLAFLFIATTLWGQPVITEQVLPKIGDTILMASDNLPERIAILGKGENQSWDMMGLQSAFTQKVTVNAVQPKKHKTPFGGKSIMVQEMGGIKSYFKNPDGHSLELLGTVGLDPMNLGVQTVTYYKKPLQTLHFPLKYGTKATNESAFYFTVAAKALPQKVLYSLPVTPDSVRYSGSIIEDKEVDAWGTLALPDNTYDVLREKNIETVRYKVAIKVGDLPWQDVTESLAEANIQTKQIRQSYHFYSNETTSKVAVAYMKPNGVNPKAVFYTVIDPTSTMRTASNRPDIYAHPNPAISDVRFEFSNLKPSNYTLKIYNILGVVVKQASYQLSGFQTVKLDISKLRKGTYLYSLSDAKGKTIATRRLMVIRP